MHLFTSIIYLHHAFSRQNPSRNEYGGGSYPSVWPQVTNAPPLPPPLSSCFFLFFYIISCSFPFSSSSYSFSASSSSTSLFSSSSFSSSFFFFFSIAFILLLLYFYFCLSLFVFYPFFLFLLHFSPACHHSYLLGKRNDVITCVYAYVALS